MHGPSSIDKFKLSISNELLDLFLHSVILVIPPHGEEFHFDLWEFSLRIINERPHNIGQLNFNIGPLDTLFRSIKVLIYCLQPSDIIMGVGNYMNVHWPASLVRFGCVRRRTMSVILIIVSTSCCRS
jgi:hypothetical protein